MILKNFTSFTSGEEAFVSLRGQAVLSSFNIDFFLGGGADFDSTPSFAAAFLHVLMLLSYLQSLGDCSRSL